MYRERERERETWGEGYTGLLRVTPDTLRDFSSVRYHRENKYRVTHRVVNEPQKMTPLSSKIEGISQNHNTVVQIRVSGGGRGAPPWRALPLPRGTPPPFSANLTPLK